MRPNGVDTGRRASLLTQYTDVLGDAVLRHRTSIAEQARRLEAEHTSKIKSQFIANMSHELRTPLNAIIGFSKFLQDAEKHALKTEQVQEYSELINHTAQQLLLIINDILDISKLQSGKVQIRREHVLISEVLTSAISVIQLSARQRNIELLTHFDKDLPFIEGDPVKLQQIFTNIINNSVKFTSPQGSIFITAKQNTKQKLQVTISDTGSGMYGAEVQIALTPFGQVDADLNSQREGTGLGLSIAKALVELHHGSLKIISAKAIGTEVQVELPLQQPQE